MIDDNDNNAAISDKNNHDATPGNDNAENVTPCETRTDDVPSTLLYGRKTTDPSKFITSRKCRPVRVKPLESSMDDPPADKNATGKAKGHAFDPTDVQVYDFFIQGASNRKDLEGVEEDQVLDIQRTIQEKLKERDAERERNITKRMKQYEEKYDFINKALLESVAQITEMAKSDHPTAAARVKLAGKMVMLPPLFDNSKLEVAKQHYKRFNQYVKFQTKSGNIREPVAEAIEFFEHTLDKKALVWFQEHKDKFVDLTTLKMMFLQRYNPWRKTKWDQLISWNILIFDPQKTDVDEHIDLINTLGDMLGQTEELKMENFIDTMPTVIQSHLITCKTWAKTNKKAKDLEHIIRKCDPPAAALPNLTKGITVPGLYSCISPSDDKDETDIPQPFKGVHPKQPKHRGREKGKQPQQKLQNPPVQVQDDQYSYEDTNNYYHNENYRDQPRGCRPYRGQNTGWFFRGLNLCSRGQRNQNPYQGQYQTMAIKVTISKAIEAYIIIHTEIFNRAIIMANLEVEAVVKVETITVAMVRAGPIIEVILTTNTISVMVMMMSTRQINMVHHVHYVVAIITLLNIVLRENMISMILWKRWILADNNHNQVVYIPEGEHDDPHELPQQQELEGSTEIEHTLYSHTDTTSPETN